jgi:hypothetical protein
MKTRFDPKLKELMNELEPIFKKYEVFAFVNATSRTHGEFRLFFPEHSVAAFETPGKIRVKYKSGVDSFEDLNATAFALFSLKDTCGEMYVALDGLSKDLNKHVVIEHERGEIYGHGED